MSNPASTLLAAPYRVMMNTFTSIQATMFLTSIIALVTRPQVQAQPLAQAIQDRQGNAWVLPMLHIEPVMETQHMRDILLDLDQFDKVIITSQHAAHFGLALIDQYWPQLPIGISWYAIGSQTARKMSYYNIVVKTSSKGIDSEALLDEEDLKSARGQKILIIKGKGGRALVAEILIARGATVEQLETYERKSPDYAPNLLSGVLKETRVNTILCASGETVTNLLHFLPASDMKNVYLVVPSQRIATAFATVPFRKIIVSDGADNTAMLATLERLETQLATSGQTNKHSEELS